ncbi:MAG: NRDE family protein [Pseudomonadota bacterium]
MCLILFAYQTHPDYPLVVIANRDEYYARPTENAGWWDGNDIFAGRDLDAGGTWLGVNRSGQFTAVTNVREPHNAQVAVKSRGELTRNFLRDHLDPETWLKQLQPDDHDYAGFNLLLGSPSDLWFYSNREQKMRALEPGIFGVSNGTFDEPWPKLKSGRQALTELIGDSWDTEQLMAILASETLASDDDLPNTGVTLEIERRLSSRFIRSPDYGTRASTVVTFDHTGRVNFIEQNFLNSDTRGERVAASFDTTGN